MSPAQKAKTVKAVKKAAKARKRNAVKKAKAPRTDLPPALLTVDEFCAVNRITKPFFHDLLRDGLGPECMKVKKRRFITPEANERWRRAREQATTQQQQQEAAAA
jgi:hypothetical protein